MIKEMPIPGRRYGIPKLFIQEFLEQFESRFAAEIKAGVIRYLCATLDPEYFWYDFCSDSPEVLEKLRVFKHEFECQKQAVLT
jgi:hypothetical protein